MITANADGGHDAVDEWPMLTNDVRMFPKCASQTWTERGAKMVTQTYEHVTHYAN